MGYVGLPLALEFSKKRSIVGFDTNRKRINELNSGFDKNLEFDEEELVNSNNLKFTSNQSDLKSVNCFIVTVPTPIDDLKQPNLMPLLAASEMIGNLIKEGDLIIYESTVYPGCIEEVCIPTIEKFSGMKINNNFTVAIVLKELILEIKSTQFQR